MCNYCVLIVIQEAQSEANHYRQLSLHQLVCPLVLRIQAPPVEISDDATWQGASQPRNGGIQFGVTT